MERVEWPHFVWLQLTRRSFLLDGRAKFVEGMVHEDVLWTLNASLRAQRIGFVEAPLYGYRVNPSSIMNNSSDAALELRARSYVAVMSGLSQAATQRKAEVELSRALLRQANREGGHFLGLMRKKIKNQSLREGLAKEFLQGGLSRSMFKGANNGAEYWRALRSWMLLKSYAAGL